MTSKHISENVDHVEDMKASFYDSVADYLTPIIQAEFNEVRKTTPELTGILFGNGGYSFLSSGEAIDWWLGDVPEHAERLYELCVLVCDECGGPSEDISIQEDDTTT